MSGWIKVTGYVSNTLFEKCVLKFKYIVLYGKLPRMFLAFSKFFGAFFVKALPRNTDESQVHRFH